MPESDKYTLNRLRGIGKDIRSNGRDNDNDVAYGMLLSLFALSTVILCFLGGSVWSTALGIIVLLCMIVRIVRESVKSDGETAFILDIVTLVISLCYSVGLLMYSYHFPSDAFHLLENAWTGAVLATTLFAFLLFHIANEHECGHLIGIIIVYVVSALVCVFHWSSSYASNLGSVPTVLSVAIGLGSALTVAASALAPKSKKQKEDGTGASSAGKYNLAVGMLFAIGGIVMLINLWQQDKVKNPNIDDMLIATTTVLVSALMVFVGLIAVGSNKSIMFDTSRVKLKYMKFGDTSSFE